MDASEAMRRGRELMDSHGLADWKIGLSEGVRTLGQCLIPQKKIVVSLRHIELNDWPMVREVVLHEIAHALVREKHGASRSVKPHGPEWKAIAREVGCEQISHSMRGHVSAERRYRGVCSCGTPHSRDRLSARHATAYVCKVCDGPIVWHDNKLGKDVV